MTILRLSRDLLDALVEEAGASTRRRKHQNLHQTFEDPCQRLLNAIAPDSYIRPHRHSLDPKAECLVAVRGKFALITFDDHGLPVSVVRFGSELHGIDEPLDVGVEVPAGTWHSVVALAPGSVLLETKAGPFDPRAAKELAPWAPEEHSPQAAAYLQGLHRFAMR